MIYGLGSQFLLRMTGFPVDVIGSLNQPALAAAGDQLLHHIAAAERAKEALLEALRKRGAETRKQRKAVERGERLVGLEGTPIGLLVDAHQAARDALAPLAAGFEPAYVAAREAARRALYRVVDDERFRTVILFSSPELDSVMPEPRAPFPVENHGVRRREVTWLSYLQRLTTKNETISFYGPSVWGRIDAGVDAAADIALDDRELDARVLYFERWPCNALAAQISVDPEVFSMLRPGWRDSIVVTDAGATSLADDRELALTVQQLQVLRRCDGRRLAAEIGDDESLRALAAAGAIDLALRIPRTDRPFAFLQAEVASWPACAARARWAERLQRIEDARLELAAAAGDLARVRAALKQLLASLEALGISRRASQALYASRLPVNEDCKRAASRVSLGRPFIEQATRDLVPWYEMWRDLAGLYATRARQRLLPIWRSMGGRPVPLASFLRACAAAGVPWRERNGLGMDPQLHDEIQAVWTEQLGDRASAPEVELTEEDLSVFRRRFSLSRMKAWDRPATDFQISAPDLAALRDGRWRLVLAEIHHDAVLWQTGALGWCPDVARLLAEFTAPGSTHHDDVELADGSEDSIHTLNMLYALAPGWTVASGETVAVGATVRGAEAMVDCVDDDLIVRHPDGRSLGWLVHTHVMFHNTHRLQLIGSGDCSPRLRVGRVVVQRRRWRLTPDAALRLELDRSEADALLALRRMRLTHAFPEEVFTQPILPMRASLHKAGKPMFVDFRNPLLVDALATQLRDYRQLLVTEMLPTTDDCWLSDHRGRYSCEFRMSAQPGADRDALVRAGFVV